MVRKRLLQQTKTTTVKSGLQTEDRGDYQSKQETFNTFFRITNQMQFCRQTFNFGRVAD